MYFVISVDKILRNNTNASCDSPAIRTLLLTIDLAQIKCTKTLKEGIITGVITDSTMLVCRTSFSL